MTCSESLHLIRRIFCSLAPCTESSCHHMILSRDNPLKASALTSIHHFTGSPRDSDGSTLKLLYPVRELSSSPYNCIMFRDLRLTSVERWARPTDEEILRIPSLDYRIYRWLVVHNEFMYDECQHRNTFKTIMSKKVVEKKRWNPFMCPHCLVEKLRAAKKDGYFSY